MNHIDTFLLSVFDRIAAGGRKTNISQWTLARTALHLGLALVMLAIFLVAADPVPDWTTIITCVAAGTLYEMARQRTLKSIEMLRQLPIGAYRSRIDDTRMRKSIDVIVVLLAITTAVDPDRLNMLFLVAIMMLGAALHLKAANPAAPDNDRDAART